MSLYSAPHFLVSELGLPEDRFEKTLKTEKLKDLTQRFLNQNKTLIERFNSNDTIRIVAFDENSGVNARSKAFFKYLKMYNRTVFYYPLLSSKQRCVIITYKREGIQLLKSYKHILAHEYAHHFHYAHTDLPYYTCKDGWIPTYSHGYKIGPPSGTAFIDKLPLQDIQGIIKDQRERVLDTICEGLLREKGVTEGFLEWYRREITPHRDPVLNTPHFMRTPNMKRYVRRLTILDLAEMGATVQLAYPKHDITSTISKARKTAIKLNKKHIDAEKIFNKIFKLSIETNFHSYKSPEHTIKHIKKTLALLNIKIETKEKW